MVPILPVATSGTKASSISAPGNRRTAIIVICSLVGILVSWILVIIVTGVVRAHRHADQNENEPLQLARRPQGSLGLGLVRAMLDKIPIVKFEDTKDGGVVAKHDVERTLGLQDPACEPSPTPILESIANAGHLNAHEFEISITDRPSELRSTTAPKLIPDAAPDVCNSSCPICTDNFITSQDLRVLPCNHQFHTDCIDPWLLNISGTCPLCRVDLNPNQSAESAERDIENNEHFNEISAGTPAMPIADNMQNSYSQHYMSKYLRIPASSWRKYNASVEDRLATLRHVREANQIEATSEEVGEQLSRNQLTTQLRNRFRMFICPHGINGSTRGGTGTCTPTVLAPAHLAGPVALESDA